jgi:hypothetical protein
MNALRIILDARGYARHPSELSMRYGDSWMLHNLAKAVRSMGHDTHVILDGYVEMYEDGISYWPSERFPQVCDVYIAPSAKARGSFRARTGITGQELWDIMPGAETHHKGGKGLKKKARSMIWTADADKGLWHLMDIWPLVKAEVPDASLVIAHNLDGYIDNFKWEHDYRGLQAWNLMEWTHEDQDITVLGQVSREVLAEHQAEASIFAYPCDPCFPRANHRSLGTLEAAAAGCALLLSPEERLYEDYEGVAAFLESPWHYEDWAEIIVRWMRSENERLEWQEKALAFGQEHTWEQFGEQWSRKLQEIGI